MALFLSSHRRRRGARGVFAAAVVALVGALAFGAPASAHNYLTSSTPQADEVLTSLPEEYVITTNDNLLKLGESAGGFLMEVAGPDGLYYGDGCVTVSGSAASMAAAAGPAGKYTLTWQVVSADGHTVSGEIPFTWQPLSPPENPSIGWSTPPECGVANEPPAPEVTEPPVADTPASDDDTTDSVTTRDDAASESGADILWIGGGIGVAAIAVIAAILFIRPKKKA